MATDYTTTEIDCPECGKQSWHEVEYLIGTGQIPRSFIECPHCRTELTIEACLDLCVNTATAA